MPDTRVAHHCLLRQLRRHPKKWWATNHDGFACISSLRLRVLAVKNPADVPSDLKIAFRYNPAMRLFTKTAGNFYLAYNATLTGDLSIGEDASFWFNAVVRGDVAKVSIGKRVNVQDGCIIHCDSGVPNVIEDDVTLGHRAIAHGTFVGRGSLVGIGAILLGRSRIGSECLIAAGAVVPPGLEVPDRMVVMGVPGRIVRPVKEQELGYMRWLTPHYVKLAEKHLADVQSVAHD